MKRYLALDSWRGICALIVALHHFTVPNVVTTLPLIRNGYLFVDFFFVLSGFVISHAYRGDDAAGFVRRRVARLWPLHLATLTAFVTFEWLRFNFTGDGFNEGRSLPQLLPNALLLQSFGADATWNWPSWSVSVEMGLYLSFVAFLMLPERWRVPLAGALVTTGMAIVAVVAPDGLAGATATETGWGRGVAGFYSGYLIYRARRPLGSTGAELGALAGALAFVSLPPSMLHAISPLVFAPVVAVFAGEGGRISAVASLRPLTTLGRWSYSVYLVHALVAVGMAAASSRLGVEAGVGPLFVYLLLVVGISALTHRYIEVPGQRLGSVRMAAAVN